MKIFLSSTYEDLKDYRMQVEIVLKMFEAVYKGMEYFGAQSSDPLETCLQYVRKADVLVCLVGTRYGSVHTDGRSYTQHEVEYANAKGIPVLGFILDIDKQPVLARHVDAGLAKKKLDKFKAYLGEIVTPASFTTPEDLGVKLATALFKRMHDLQEPQTDAFVEIAQRIFADKSAVFDAFTLTAHNLDLIHKVDLVAADYETTITHPVECPGGSGANTIYALAKLGANVGTAGIIATDSAGRLLKDDLGSCNVISDCILEISPNGKMGTGKALVFVDQEGRRSIFVNPGVNEIWSKLVEENGQNKIIIERMRNCKIVHLSSFTSTRERNLKEKLVKDIDRDHILSFTPGSLYAKLGLDGLSEMLSRTNILFLYQEQLDALLRNSIVGNIPREMPLQGKLEKLFQWKKTKNFGQPLIVVIKSAVTPVKAASPPQYLHIGCGRHSLEDFRAPQTSVDFSYDLGPKDTTGAGDALAAGVLYGLLNKKNIVECAGLGFIMAVLASQEIGARPGLPDMERLQRFYNKWFYQ